MVIYVVVKMTSQSKGIKQNGGKWGRKISERDIWLLGERKGQHDIKNFLS